MLVVDENTFRKFTEAIRTVVESLLPIGSVDPSQEAPIVNQSDSSPSSGDMSLSSCRQAALNPFRRAVTLTLQIIEDERTRRSSRPFRKITQEEFAALQLQNRQCGADCRIIARRLGWDDDRVEKAIDDLEWAIIGLFKRGPDDPHGNDPGEWFVWSVNRCTTAAVVVQKFADDYDADLRLTAPSGGIAITSHGKINDRRDREFMEMAIQEARKSIGEDGRSHPKVGAVVIKDGRVLAAAHRGELGPGDHAEYTALEKKLPNEAIAGATVYATLEPCTTRNPPKISCAKRLIERKVKRVVIGMLDPNPNIRGNGMLLLREHNIEIGFFPPDLMAILEELNRDFTRAQSQAGMPLPEQPASSEPKGPAQTCPDEQAITEASLRRLPRRAMLALAARCARRVQPLYDLPADHPEREKHIEAIEKAIQVAEAFAKGVVLPACWEPFDTVQRPACVAEANAAFSAATTLEPACTAAAAVFQTAFAAWAAATGNDTEAISRTLLAIQTADTTDTRAAFALGGNAALRSATFVRDAAIADLQKLLELRLGTFPNLGLTVDPCEAGPLGPLWLNRQPDWYQYAIDSAFSRDQRDV
jgi:pyrimidine deaminase RibD-like protein